MTNKRAHIEPYGYILLVENFHIFEWVNPKDGTLINFARGTTTQNTSISAFIKVVTFKVASYAFLYHVQPTKTETLRCTAAMELSEEKFWNLVDKQDQLDSDATFKLASPNGKILLDAQFFSNI